MASKKSHKLNIAISTVLLALFLFLAFRNVNLGELVSSLEKTNYLYIFIGMSIGVVFGMLVRAFRWRVLLTPIKANISLKNLYSATSIGYMVNNLIPRSGEVVRPYLLGKNEDISKASAFGTIIIESVMFLLMFGLALIYFKNRISNAFPEISSAVIILASLIFLLLFWILFMMFKTEQSLKVVKFLTRILPGRYRLKIEKVFSSLVFGFDVLKKPNLLLKIAVYSILLWLVYLISTFIPFYSFGIIVNNGSGLINELWNANLLLVLINVALFIPVPAATGPYHYVCKVTLVSIFSVSEVKALSYATSTHIMSFLVYLVVGLYYFIISNYRISELKEKTV